MCLQRAALGRASLGVRDYSEPRQLTLKMNANIMHIREGGTVPLASDTSLILFDTNLSYSNWDFQISGSTQPYL
jgi:hypothetical protein